MKLFVAAISFALAAPALAGSLPAPTAPVKAEMKPESYPYWQIMGSVKPIKLWKAAFSRATDEQFHVALEAVRAAVLKEAARQTKEANEGGGHWIVSDHAPGKEDPNQNYQVIEMEQYHHDRKFTPFVVRTRMFGYSAEGDWAWTSNKYVRYLVYVGDDNQVLAMKEDGLASVIDFYEWKLKNDEAREKREKALRPAGYSTELTGAEEEEAPAAASAE